MNILTKSIDFILHVDTYLSTLIELYGPLVYLFLFLIILAETGLVIAPLLPGDSLLFIAGAFAARGSFSVLVLVPLLIAAAILGDTLNYAIGHYFGRQSILTRYIKPKYIEKTEAFYQKHGGKAIIMARFVPIVRTIIPFVAGVGAMNYTRFLLYNVLGAVLWVTLFVFAGYFFGTIPIVEENLTLVTFGIIILSLIPPIIEYLRERFHK